MGKLRCKHAKHRIWQLSRRDSRVETPHIQKRAGHGALTTFSKRIGYFVISDFLSLQ